MLAVAWTPGPGDFAQQEAALVSAFRLLRDVGSVLDLGCGYGRVAHLLHRALIQPTRYVGVDHDPEHLAVARDKALPSAVFVESRVQDFETDERFDLVVAVELLMHLPPAQVGAVIAKMVGWSSHYVLSCDWTRSLSGTKTYDHNWRHDYRTLYGPQVVEIDAGPLQSVFLAVP